MAPRRVLVVEDNALIASGYQDLLEEQGHQVVGLARSNADALSLIQNEEFDFALLDVDLQGEESEPVAAELARLGIPFLVLTGTMRGMIAGSHLLAAPMLSKPAIEAELVAAIAELDAG